MFPKFHTRLEGAAVLLLLLFSCVRQPDPVIETLDIRFAQDETITFKGGDFFLKVSCNGNWKIETRGAGDWYQFSRLSGQGDQTLVLSISENKGATRSATIDVVSGKMRKSLSFTQPEYDEQAALFPRKEAYRIEVPRLSDSFAAGGSRFVVHYAKDNNGKSTLNYCFEYHLGKHHSRWIAFTFDANTCQKHTNRTDLWAPDPELPQYTDNEMDYRGSGYTRGHLLASADRLFSRQANEQTFYFSNISPQKYSFNTGIWLDLEDKVRNWGRLSEIRDTLYVVKGGTIDDHQTMGTIGIHKIAVPQYFFMAILAKKGSRYRSIAFLFEHHRSYGDPPYQMHQYALSVDELEEKTGIDFFHNLPDEVETLVEQQRNSNDWPGL